MTILYSYHKDYPESILVREFVGAIGISDIVDSWKYILNSGMIRPETKGIINVLLDCVLDMNMDDFCVNIDFIRNNEQLRRLKLAVLCDDPKIMVFPTMGQHGEPDLKIRPFSTERAAINWIIFQ